LTPSKTSTKYNG